MKTKSMSTFIYYILDESGSMSSRVDQVISGFNEFLQEHENIEDCRVSLYTFHSRVTTVFEGIPIKSVKKLDREHYTPSGMTALWDAMGHVLQQIPLPLAEQTNKYIVIILTDGEENSSTLYRPGALKDMIKMRPHMELVYVGSNQDAVFNAQVLGGTDKGALSYSDCNLKQAMRATTDAVKRYCTQTTPHVEFTQNERVSSLS